MTRARGSPDTITTISRRSFVQPNQSSERVWVRNLNASGLAEREIDCNGSTTRFTYDERLLLAAITRGGGKPEASTNKFRHNPSGEVTGRAA
ncbi:MAG: hypothetical protein M3545_16390 [Acidobacteriota bacterium]|nr:hypothetical protein [Acidobacteriota bacterium]